MAAPQDSCVRHPARTGFRTYRGGCCANDAHRLIYRVVDDEVRIVACRYQYGR
nr:type II toxin-antitoxin system YoeB family toxin [Streptomyces pratensis]